MKAIMISIKPKYVADILNGKKTIEIRKTMPKCDLPIDVYIYCTKQKKTSEWAKRNTLCSDVYDGKITGHYQLWSTDIDDGLHTILNGKVVAKFTLDKVEEIKKIAITNRFATDTIGDSSLLISSCLEREELHSYLKGKKGYAWHIDNLEIFDKPKEISEFSHYDNSQYQALPNGEQYRGVLEPLTRAPQSWCYIEV